MGWSKGVNWLNKVLKAKELEEAKKAEEQAKILEDYKRLKGAEEARFKALSMEADKAWENQRPMYIQDDINAFKNNENAEDFIRYLIDKHGPYPVDFNAYRDVLSSGDIDKITTFFDNNYKKYLYNNYYENHAGDIDYKQYYKPTSETPNTEPLSAPLKNEIPRTEVPNNVTEAVTPEAEAIDATTTATTEVPKEPTSAGILKNALNKFKKDPKDLKAIGKTLKIITPGTLVGGVSGEFATEDEAPWQTHLRNILTGAALGAVGKAGYYQLRPKIPPKGKMLKYGAGLSTIGGGLYYKKDIKDYADKLWNPTTSKPEDTPPPIGTPLGTPAKTYQQNTSGYTKIKKG